MLSLESRKQALGDGMIPALTGSGQRLAYVVGLEHLDEPGRRVLLAAVGMEDQPGSRPAVTDGHA